MTQRDEFLKATLPAPDAYSLRVTTIFRRENDEWKVVHRHGDPIPDGPATQKQLDRLSVED